MYAVLHMCVTIVTATLSNGGSISVSAEDDDGDGLIYTMTTVPDSVSLDIESGECLLTAKCNNPDM